MIADPRNMAAAAEDDAFERIRAILAARHGAGQAATIDELAAAAEISRRACEHILETRFEQFPFLLVSGTSGYFRPVSAEELNTYYNSLQSRLVKLAMRRRTLRRKAATNGFRRDGKCWVALPVVCGQMEMALFRAP
jgi:hypothetical protein